MSGYICLHRGWRDSEVFADEALTEREAWVWLLEKAAWKPCVRRNAKGERVEIGRGQFHTSLRTLGEAWGWGKNKVSRYLERLEEHDMIGTVAGQSGCIISICNYSKYQNVGDSQADDGGTVAGQSRDTQEETKPLSSHIPTTSRERAQGFALPSDIPTEEWAGFEEMRVRIRKPLTDYARRQAVKRLRALSEDGWPPGDVLNHSILNNYQGLFPPKDQANGNRPANDRRPIQNPMFASAFRGSGAR